MSKLSKVFKELLISIVAITIILFMGSIFFEKVYPYPIEIKYGVTFSPQYAKFLKLDWQQTYLKIMDELKVKNLRLPSYWNIVQKKEEMFNFSQTDFMVMEADRRRVKVILVLGVRQPRWPECHIPNWAKKLSVKVRQQKILNFIQKVVERYKDSQAIWAWQVENEPLLATFGEGCDRPDENFLKSEVELVRKLDKRPIILTDSGELGGWRIPMQLSDVFGFSIYRTVYNPIFGYQNYPVLPYLYNLKSDLVKNLFAKNNKKTIVVELQAEPWLSPENQLNAQKQSKLFSEKELEKNVEFTKRSGFDEIYLWGVEWWYFMEKNGYPQYLDYAKSLFR